MKLNIVKVKKFIRFVVPTATAAVSAVVGVVLEAINFTSDVSLVSRVFSGLVFACLFVPSYYVLRLERVGFE